MQQGDAWQGRWGGGGGRAAGPAPGAQLPACLPVAPQAASPRAGAPQAGEEDGGAPSQARHLGGSYSGPGCRRSRAPQSREGAAEAPGGGGRGHREVASLGPLSQGSRRPHAPAPTQRQSRVAEPVVPGGGEGSPAPGLMGISLVGEKPQRRLALAVRNPQGRRPGPSSLGSTAPARSGLSSACPGLPDTPAARAAHLPALSAHPRPRGDRRGAGGGGLTSPGP